jgi:glycosyltransferase involved in cell wall biosynthesis
MITPLLSIVIVTKNELQDLKVAVDSVQKQDFKNYELIIIDGMSSDGTLEFLQKNDDVVWLSEPDNGPYFAMNKAIKIAKGEYIYFLGSDDYLISNTILSEISIHLIENLEKSIIFNFKVDDGGVAIYPATPIKYDGLLRGTKLCHQGVVMPLKLIKSLSGFDERFRIASDHDLIIRAIKNNNIIVNYDSVLAFYCHGGLSDQGSLHETILILLKNEFYVDAIRFIAVEYMRIFFIKVKLLSLIRNVRFFLKSSLF